MIVVSNTSPIINLATIGQLNLLEKLFEKILIPKAVYHEIAVIGEGLAGAKEVNDLTWIETKEINNRALIKALSKELDEGEAEAIALAEDTNADLLLLDERVGREVALRFDIKFIYERVLSEAKENGQS